MDVQYLNPFIGAVRHVCRTMLNAEVRIGKPRGVADETDSADVSGIIGFSGDAAGCIALCFPVDVASKVASRFAGTELPIDHADFADAIGELANIVAGNAKKDFHGMTIMISLPSVVIGKRHTVSQSRVAPRFVIPCETDFGRFHVEVGMTMEKSRQRAVPVTAGVRT